jgi:hypothetical protein
MCHKTSEGDSFELDTDEGERPSQEQRDALVRDILIYAGMFPPGPEQNELRSIARALTFFDAKTSEHPDEDPSNKSKETP